MFHALMFDIFREGGGMGLACIMRWMFAICPFRERGLGLSVGHGVIVYDALNVCHLRKDGLGIT